MTRNTTLNIATPTEREIVITRVFAAPRRQVWDAMTRPELLKKWLSGPPGWSMTSCQDDARAGGTFRWVWRGPEGAEMAMRGEYREVVPPGDNGSEARIVRTETFEFGCESQGGEQLGTLVLTEREGRTFLTLTLLYPSKEARDATIASGMAEGVGAGYDRLDEVLAG